MELDLFIFTYLFGRGETFDELEDLVAIFSLLPSLRSGEHRYRELMTET